MMKAYDLPNGLRLQYEEGKQPDGAVEHKCAQRVVAKPAPKAAEPKEEKAVEAKEAKPKNKAVKPANKAKKAAKK
jgi:hypothetical protein